MKLNLQFKKFDKFDNPVFGAKQDNIPESYDKLTKIYKKLNARSYDTYLPIYSHPEFGYSTIRFFKNSKYVNFKVGATYEVSFSINKKKKNDKTYVNCYISKMKFISKAETVDQGEEMEFSDSEDSDSDSPDVLLYKPAN